MPEIKTKQQLIDRLRAGRAELEKMIARAPIEQMEKPGTCGDWSAKDVLAHVAHWQELHLGWWAAEQRGETPSVPAPGFTWKDTDRLNHQIYLAHRDQTLEAVLAYLRETFEQFMAIVEATPEADLFRPGAVSFTGGGTLANWYKNYVFHDGFGRNKIYQALVRQRRAPGPVEG